MVLYFDSMKKNHNRIFIVVALYNDFYSNVWINLNLRYRKWLLVFYVTVPLHAQCVHQQLLKRCTCSKMHCTKLYCILLRLKSFKNTILLLLSCLFKEFQLSQKRTSAAEDVLYLRGVGEFTKHSWHRGVVFWHPTKIF